MNFVSEKTQNTFFSATTRRSLISLSSQKEDESVASQNITYNGYLGKNRGSRIVHAATCTLLIYRTRRQIPLPLSLHSKDLSNDTRSRVCGLRLDEKAAIYRNEHTLVCRDRHLSILNERVEIKLASFLKMSANRGSWRPLL